MNLSKNLAQDSEERLCPLCELPSEAYDYCEHCGNFKSRGNDISSGGPLKGLHFDTKTNMQCLDRSWIKWWTLVIAAGSFFLGASLLKDAWTLWQAEQRLNFWLLGIPMPLIYLSLALLINRTAVRFSNQKLAVSRGPLWIPLMDSFELKTNEIYNIEMFRSVRNGKYGKDISYIIRVFTVDHNLCDIFDFDNNEAEAKTLLNTLRKTFSQSKKPQLEPVTNEVERPKDFDKAKAWRMSQFYYFLIPSSLMLNLPALHLVKVWRWDLGFWLVLGAYTLAWFCLTYFHHRKYLSFWDSLPLRPSYVPVGWVPYMVMSAIMAFMECPVVMWIYNVVANLSSPAA